MGCRMTRPSADKSLGQHWGNWGNIRACPSAPVVYPLRGYILLGDGLGRFGTDRGTGARA